MRHENSTSLSEQNLSDMGWYDLYPICIKLCMETKRDMMEVITTTFASPDDPPQGSLAAHYRGRYKYEGLDSLIEQMDNKGMRRLIIALSENQ